MLIHTYARTYIIDTSTSTGWTPLIFMVTRNHIEGVNRLIQAGADINKAEDDGWTPLMMASELGDIDIATILLDAGADVFQQTFTGRTALACAEAGKHTALANLLQKAIAHRMNVGKNSRADRNNNSRNKVLLRRTNQITSFKAL